MTTTTRFKRRPLSPNEAKEPPAVNMVDIGLGHHTGLSRGFLLLLLVCICLSRLIQLQMTLSTVVIEWPDSDVPLVVSAEFHSTEDFWATIDRFNDSIRELSDEVAISFEEDDRSVAPAILVGRFAGVAGGKGGFGAQLRSLAKQKGQKQTRDFGACRDLSGRRLRSVNHEIILAKWKEARDKGEAFNVDQETPTGINLWFMAVPTWADTTKESKHKKFLKSRYKTTICADWQRARLNRTPPPGAPAFWGCPRGARCEFAHGEDELQGASRDELLRSVQSARRDELQQAKEAYMAPLLLQNDALADISESVAEGLRASKRSKKTTDATDEAASERATRTAAASSSGSRLASGRIVANVSPDGVGVIGDSKFGTIVLESMVCDAVGRYYFEVDLATDGLMQIGWCDDRFAPTADADEAGDGVGDCSASWAIDGLRKITLHEGKEQACVFGASAEGMSWETGDTLGCWLSIAAADGADSSRSGSGGDNGNDEDDDDRLVLVRMGFVLQGLTPQAAVAFEFTRRLGDCRFHPAASLEQGESVVINVQQRPFLFQDVADTAAQAASSRSASSSSSSAVAAPQSSATSEAPSAVEVPTEALAAAQSAEDLLQFSLDALKAALIARGVKCGGTHVERATRLFSIRNLSPDEIDPKLRAPAKK